MKRRRAVSVLGLALSGALVPTTIPASGPTASGSATLNVMTFNIRLDVAQDGANAWPHRHDLVASMLRFHRVDVAGVQEALSHQLAELVREATDYRSVGVGRDDGHDAGEFSAILYRHDRFDLGTSGTFWLSATPEVPGSKGWDAAFPRVATWARLRDRRSGREILVVNTHLDHRGVEARRESAALLTAWIRDRGGATPTVLLGDFNCTSASDPYRILTAEGGLVDSATLSEIPHHGPTFTFQGFDFGATTGDTIDFAFLRNHAGVHVLRHGTLTDHRDGRYPSDHFPVLVELEWR